MPKLDNNAFSSATIRVVTPDGTMFVNILEDEKGDPFQIIINLGKGGSATSAWSSALAELCSALLKSGTSIVDLIVYLSGISSEKYKASLDGPSVKSGPSGLMIALLKYRDSKYNEPEEPEYYRPPRINGRLGR